MGTPKFPMHDYHLKKSLKICVQAVLLSMGSGLAYYFFQHLPLRASYRNFYATYDPVASFNRMRDGGYLQSCPPETSSKSDKNDENDKDFKL